MNDLPVGTQYSNAPLQQQTDNSQGKQVQQPLSVHTAGAEHEGFTIAPELPVKQTAVEVDLPKEVQAAGVSQVPTTVQLPQIVQKQGVSSVGHNVPSTPTSGSTIVLPLTEQQIEKAMKSNVNQSIRWLAEWCVYHMRKIWNHK